MTPRFVQNAGKNFLRWPRPLRAIGVPRLFHRGAHVLGARGRAFIRLKE
jgi:hypothetical protein